MDKKRAQEIIASLPLVQVHYHGIPVFLQTIHQEGDTATIFPLDEMHHSQTVDLDGLSE